MTGIKNKAVLVGRETGARRRWAPMGWAGPTGQVPLFIKRGCEVKIRMENLAPMGLVQPARISFPSCPGGEGRGRG